MATGVGVEVGAAVGVEVAVGVAVGVGEGVAAPKKLSMPATLGVPLAAHPTRKIIGHETTPRSSQMNGRIARLGCGGDDGLGGRI